MDGWMDEWIDVYIYNIYVCYIDFDYTTLPPVAWPKN